MPDHIDTLKATITGPAGQPPELTYFGIEGVAEKVRLAFAMCNVEFKDNRIGFPDWAAMKPNTPYGQLPVLKFVGDTTFAQSGAMMRYICSNLDKNGTLYPVNNPSKMIEIEEIVGLVDDFSKSWAPSLYLGMGFHQNFGHPEEWPEKDEVVKKVRQRFCENEFPKFMGFFKQQLLKANNGASDCGFLCGKDVTLADLYLLPQLRYFTRGVADHVPKDIVEGYPEIMSYIERMYEVEQIKEWYAGK